MAKIVQDPYYGPLSKTEIRTWMKRERENLRDLEAALASEDWLLVELLATEVGATGAEIQGRLEAFIAGQE